MTLELHKNLIDELVTNLNDNDEPMWPCPQCDNIQHKGGADHQTLAPVPYTLNCEECGFDAKPFAPEQLLNWPKPTAGYPEGS